MEIYILAGQSNMAGRGNCEELPTRYQSHDNGECKTAAASVALQVAMTSRLGVLSV